VRKGGRTSDRGVNISLSTAIYPFSPVTFFTDYWEKKPLFLTESNRGPTFEHLLGTKDLDYLISSLSFSDPNWILLVKDGLSLPHAKLLDRESFVDLAKIRHAFASGYTIQLSKLQRRWAPVGAFARDLEIDFVRHSIPLAKHISVHAYFTPRNSRGLGPHYDDHNVFVVQLQGGKTWRIYGPGDQFPIRPQEVGDNRNLPDLLHEDDMRAGDVLYIPRGFYHEARASDDTSLHLSLSVYPHTWLDLFHEMMSFEPEFRQALPPGARSEQLDRLRNRINFSMNCDNVEGAMDRLIQKFAASLHRLPAEGINELPPSSLTVRTKIERCRGLLARTSGETTEEIKLQYYGSELTAPVEFGPVFSFLTTAESFLVDDLPDLLAPDEKIQVVKQLIDDGFLRIA
jgi:hypothetical protein